MRDTAGELANVRDLARGDQTVSAECSNLTSALTKLLPATIERGGAAVVNGASSVLACEPLPGDRRAGPGGARVRAATPG